MMRLCRIAAVAAAVLAGGTARADIRTLQDALAAAYSTDPTLLAARAQLRATDEGVPQALAGWRPTVVLSGAAGDGDGTFHQVANGSSIDRPNHRDIFPPQ